MKILLVEDEVWNIFTISGSLGTNLPETEVELLPHFTPLPWEDKETFEQNGSAMFPSIQELISIIEKSDAELILLDYHLGNYCVTQSILDACLRNERKVIGIGSQNKIPGVPNFQNKSSLPSPTFPEEAGSRELETERELIRTIKQVVNLD